MKRRWILFVVAIFSYSISTAKIWRVNNNPGTIADFTSAQSANDNVGVLAGDSIHLEPSVTSYGDLTCTKRLVWFSIGNFLGIHSNEEYSLNAGRIDVLTVNVAGCANSVFHVNAGMSRISASGVKMDRCLLSGLCEIGLDGIPINIVVINSYLKSLISIYYADSITITNNIIESALTVSSNCTYASITQNVINAHAAGGNNISNSKVENNIFNQATFSYTFTNCIVQYNMSGAAGILPAGNNNQNSVAMSTVFVDNNGTDDASFVLKAGSPAINAGSGSLDLGAFGGSTPFKLALQPAIPSIYNIRAQVAPAGNSFNVTFSTKSHN